MNILLKKIKSVNCACGLRFFYTFARLYFIKWLVLIF